jgi:hypothetical protein
VSFLQTSQLLIYIYDKHSYWVLITDNFSEKSAALIVTMHPIRKIIIDPKTDQRMAPTIGIQTAITWDSVLPIANVAFNSFLGINRPTYVEIPMSPKPTNTTSMIKIGEWIVA